MYMYTKCMSSHELIPACDDEAVHVLHVHVVVCVDRFQYLSAIVVARTKQ